MEQEKPAAKRSLIFQATQKESISSDAVMDVKVGSVETKNIISSQVKETISVEYKSPDDSTHKEIKREINTLKTKTFDEEPVVLHLDFSHTIPMRPYESAKISVGLSIPIGKVLDEDLVKTIDSVYGFASNFIESKIEKEVLAIQDFVKKVK